MGRTGPNLYPKILTLWKGTQNGLCDEGVYALTGVVKAGTSEKICEQQLGDQHRIILRCGRGVQPGRAGRKSELRDGKNDG